MRLYLIKALTDVVHHFISHYHNIFIARKCPILQNLTCQPWQLSTVSHSLLQSTIKAQIRSHCKIFCLIKNYHFTKILTKL